MELLMLTVLHWLLWGFPQGLVGGNNPVAKGATHVLAAITCTQLVTLQIISVGPLVSDSPCKEPAPMHAFVHMVVMSLTVALGARATYCH